MGTSKSSDWTASARVYSGRPDPVWPVDPPAAQALVALWEALTPRESPAVEPPLLGYRGVVLHAPDGRAWWAYGGAVTLTPGGESREDRGREFERQVRATAPPRTLPRW